MKAKIKEHTQCTLSPIQFLPLLQATKGFSWPSPQKGIANQKDKSRFCEYHKEHGYVTNQCYQLHKLLESMV